MEEEEVDPWAERIMFDGVLSIAATKAAEVAALKTPGRAPAVAEQPQVGRSHPGSGAGLQETQLAEGQVATAARKQDQRPAIQATAEVKLPSVGGRQRAERFGARSLPTSQARRKLGRKVGGLNVVPEPRVRRR